VQAAIFAGLAEAARVEPGACPSDLELVLHASGRAPEAGRRALEGHLHACARCAFETERVQRAVRAGGRPPRARRAVGTAAGLVRALRGLVTFEMPASLALTTRSGGASVARFARAMRDYRAGRFARARAGLEAALAAGERPPELHFYLGACLMRGGDAEQAADRFRAAVNASPRLGEYRFYLAQALLALGRAEEAVQQLAKAAALPGTFKLRARSLARSVKEHLERARS
jgi:tetratricopeptide (TPR) repeat protein